MKRNLLTLLLIVMIILLVTLVGCKEKNIEKDSQEIIDKVEQEEGIEKEPDPEKIMRDFKNIVGSNNEPIVVLEFIDKNIDKVLEEDAVEMIKDLEQTQGQYLEDYSQELSGEGYQKELLSIHKNGKIELFFDNSDLEKIDNIMLKELMEKLIGGKYKLIIMEESFYPIIDYEALKVYNKHLSAEMEDYIGIKSIDSNDPIALDAGLVITFDQLADRIIKAENYLENYPNSINEEEILRLYGSYLKFYMEGIDNTQIYEYETNIIKDEVLASYGKTAKLEDSITSDIITKYIDIIEENQFEIDDTVFSQITSLYNQAIGRLEDYK